MAEFNRAVSVLEVSICSDQGRTLSELLGVQPVAQRVMRVNAPDIEPRSRDISDMNVEALCHSIYSVSTRDLGSLSNLEPWYRQGLASYTEMIAINPVPTVTVSNPQQTLRIKPQ